MYFLGGVHAREWGSCDILVNFVAQIEQAYIRSTDLTFGGKTFRAAEIKTIVDNLHIFVFPQANPDGRNYSMTTNAGWRKNRRPPGPNSAGCSGVDLNRNYEFLWDFPIHFSPSAPILDSTRPCSDYYRGERAFSEPETRNACWIVENFPNVRFFIDLHCSGQDILYSWGDDDDQTTDPNMNFMNPAYDGTRGTSGAYKEYIPADDLATALSLGTALHDGIKAVRGTDYIVEPSFGGLYPTAGTSDDYFYSRHFADIGKTRILAYTLEWGAEFQPPYAEMRNIIGEITAGLLAFCLAIARTAPTRKGA